MFIEQTADVSYPVNERDLIAEANHRIANNLGLTAALARQQIAALTDDHDAMPPAKVRAILAEFVGRIEAVGRLHRMLSSSESEGPVDVGTYLQQVVSEVVSSMARPDSIVLHFACQLGCRAPAERTLHIGLMVVELVVNSVKHAHPAGVRGHIEIRARRDPHAIVVGVSDDGVGLPDGFRGDSAGGSGMRLIHALARQIGASVRFESGGLGLRCEIVAPVAAAVAGDGHGPG